MFLWKNSVLKYIITPFNGLKQSCYLPEVYRRPSYITLLYNILIDATRIQTQNLPQRIKADILCHAMTWLSHCAGCYLLIHLNRDHIYIIYIKFNRKTSNYIKPGPNRTHGKCKNVNVRKIHSGGTVVQFSLVIAGSGFSQGLNSQ